MKKGDVGSRPVRLSRLFALFSLVLIILACIASSLLISRFVSQKMIQRDAETSTAFVQSLAVVQQARGYFLGHTAPDENLNEFFRHVLAMPDVVRANIYARDRTVLWSSNPVLIGKRFLVNEELDEIFMEKGKSHSGVIGEDVIHKAEHQELKRDQKIIETYVAVLDPETRLVMGAIEFYKNPQSLWGSMETINRLIWCVAAGFGALLYIALILFMRRLAGDYSQLNPDFRMAKIMALAVSRGMQNSAARPASTRPDSQAQHASHLAQWTESLERYATQAPVQLEATVLQEVINQSINGLNPHFEAAKIHYTTDFPANLPKVMVDPVWLQVAIDSIIQHAIDAIPPGGKLSISAHADEAHDAVYLEMRDTGAGYKSGPKSCEMTSDDLELARNLVSRMDGKLILAPLIDGACDRTLRLNIEAAPQIGTVRTKP